jgi:nucleotide-binding universal stress UspA family protein
MKVLLAIDGSAHAREAEEFVSQFPFASSPDLVLVTVCPSMDLHVVGPDVPASVNDLVDQCRAEGEKLLGETRQRCAAWAASVETKLLDGHPSQEIVGAAEGEQADLVVLGARGLGTVQRFFLGSVSDKVSKYADCSVLIVRGDGSGQSPPLERILIADDGSSSAAKAIERFSAFPLESHRQVKLLEALEATPVFGMEYSIREDGRLQENLSAIQNRLASQADRLKATGASVETQLYQAAPNVADAILDVAKEDRSDLIVVGSTGQSRWQRLMLGSVSSRIVHHADCSVWIERQRRN